MMYEYACHECELFIEKDFRMGKAKKKVKCPECKKFAERYFGGSAPPVHFKGDFRTNVTMKKNSRSNSADINEFYDDAMRMSKERTKTGYQHYSRMNMDTDYFIRNGLAKKRTDDQVKTAKKTTKAIGPQVANKHNPNV